MHKKSGSLPTLEEKVSQSNLPDDVKGLEEVDPSVWTAQQK